MRVAWVHPSWRDLVIEQLSRDPERRRRFLERCGPAGVGLALSTRGGARGERRLPLMGCDADWDALGDRLHELLGEVDLPELISLLSVLREAVSALPPSASERLEAISLAEAGLRRVTRRWDTSRAPIPLPGLEAWLEAASVLPRTPTVPSLGVTWAELLPVRVPSPEDGLEVRRFTDWLTLCRLLWDWPAAWETLDFGREQLLLGVQFIEVAEQRGEVSEQVLAALEAIVALIPQLRPRTRRVVTRAARRSALDPAPAIAPPDPIQLEELDVARVLSDL